MTIHHTVVFRLPYPAGSPEETRFFQAARTALTSIPGVEDFVIRRQVNPTSELTAQFAMRFADERAYAAYNRHPRHVDFVVSRWGGEVDAFQEYDFTEL